MTKHQSHDSTKFLGELEKTALQLQLKLLEYTKTTYGEEVIAYAWEEFNLFSEAGLDAEEFSTIFPTWFLYTWVPSVDEDEEEHEHEHDSCCGHHAQCCDSNDEEDEDCDSELDELEDEEEAYPPAILALEDEKLSFSDLEEEFIEATCDAPFSLFLVKKVDSRQLVVHDQILDTEHTVNAIGYLPDNLEGKIILARILTVQGVEVLYGVSPFSVSGSHQERIRELVDSMRMMDGEVDAYTVALWDMAIREFFYGIVEEEDSGSQIAPDNLEMDALFQDESFMESFKEIMSAAQAQRKEEKE